MKGRGRGVGIEEHVSFAGIIQKNQVQPFDLRTHVSWLQAISQAQWLEVDSLSIETVANTGTCSTDLCLVIP